MELSEAGEKALIQREGYKKKAYKDTKGIWTIGVGHTGPEVKEGLVWTDEQVMEAFRKDVQWAVDTVNEVPAPLNQNMFDALVSFVFNVGASAFRKSTMRKHLCVQDYSSAYNEFDRWVIPPEITKRRMGEKKQFFTPV